MTDTRTGTRTTGTVERAFELARSGMCGSISHIEMQLVREHHSNVHAHLAGSALRKTLRRMCREAAGAGDAARASTDGPDT